MRDPLDSHLPLNHVDFHILLVLTEAPLHGYGIMKAVERESAGRVLLQLGSLYRVIARLEETGLLASRPTSLAGSGPGKPKRTYEITALGRAVLEAESNRLFELAERVRAREFKKEGLS